MSNRFSSMIWQSTFKRLHSSLHSFIVMSYLSGTGMNWLKIGQLVICPPNRVDIINVRLPTAGMSSSNLLQHSILEVSQDFGSGAGSGVFK